MHHHKTNINYVLTLVVSVVLTICGYFLISSIPQATAQDLPPSINPAEQLLPVVAEIEISVVPILHQQLPELPEHLAAPFENIQNQQTLSSASELEDILTAFNYDMEKIRNDQLLPPVYVINLPPDLNQLTVPQKTSLFIQLLLTSVLQVNSDIMEVRNELISLQGKLDQNTALTQEEQQWLADVASDHQGSADNIEALLERVDILPVGLTMAQAIDESGWGTSHFAIEGNALYGQHLSSDSEDSYITTASGNIRVASFDNLYHSTASYIHTLNTTRAYEKLRTDRASLRRENAELNAEQFADSLLDYSERGQHYVDTLKWLINHYQLNELENVQPDPNIPAILISFN